nr:MAG TPA: hypothetical protein [Caudoviricetes sp.]
MCVFVTLIHTHPIHTHIPPPLPIRVSPPRNILPKNSI